MARIYHRHDHASHAQERILSIIRGRGSISQKELMAMLEVRSSSLSEILLKLERAGHIKKEKNPEDKRGFVITPCVEQALSAPREELPREPNPSVDPFACLTPEEKEQLKGILGKLIHTLKQESDLPSHKHCHHTSKHHRGH